jgi:uncharacterized protein (DUF58 family)
VLPDEVASAVRQIQLLMKRTVNELLAGEYSSAFRGRGMEFAEVRAYQPGDDVRTIDWNVTARTGEPHVKQFVEERELTIMLVVDLSASGAFGSVDRFKNETAAELCAVLASVANMSNDKVGLLVFTDRVERFDPPRKGSRHALRLVRDVLSFDAEGHATDAPVALEHLAGVLRKRAVVFVISDFLFEGAGSSASSSSGGASRFESALKLLARRHDVVALRVSDPREHQLPRAGLIELADAETGERRLVDTSSRRVRERFAARAHRHNESLRGQMRRLGVDYAEVTTHEPYVRTLIELFKRREKRR